MTKHGGSFQLSGDTRDLLRKHGDFFDQLTSLQGDDEASGQIPLKLKGKDPEAHTEAKILSALRGALARRATAPHASRRRAARELSGPAYRFSIFARSSRVWTFFGVNSAFPAILLTVPVNVL